MANTGTLWTIQRLCGQCRYPVDIRDFVDNTGTLWIIQRLSGQYRYLMDNKGTFRTETFWTELNIKHPDQTVQLAWLILNWKSSFRLNIFIEENYHMFPQLLITN